MRIAYMLTSLGMGGAERHTIVLAEDMAARGHAVLLISLLGRQSEEWTTGLDVVRLNLRKKPISLIFGLLRARVVLRKFQPDILHSHTFPANLFARLIRVLVPAKVVCTMHNVFEGGPLRMLAYRATDFLAVHTTAVSEAVAQRAIQTQAVPARKCTVTPNAIDTAEFMPDAARRVDTRVTHNAADNFIWLAAGRIVAAKGFLTLLEAFAHVLAEYPQTQLWIAGERSNDGSRKSGWPEKRESEKRELTGLVVPKGTMERVHRLGLRHDMPALLDAADAFVLASAWEGMPLVIGEAMAMQKPVVATDVGGVFDMLGETGTLVPARDPNTLARAMLNVMRMPPELRESLGRAERERVVECFDTRVLFRRWESFYCSLLAGASPQ